MDRLVVVKFHINIANRWLFMTKKNNGYHSLFIKLGYLDMFRGPFFPDTVYNSIARERLMRSNCENAAQRLSLLNYSI